MLYRIFGVVVLASVLVTVFGASVQVDGNAGGCVLPVPRFAFFMPLVFDPTGDLIQTKHVQNVTLLPNDRVILSCYPNYFTKMPLEQVIRASCKNGEILTVNGVEKNWLKDLGCEVRAVEEIVTPVQGCSSEMESVEFGYANPIKEKSLILGEACYSVQEGRTHFIHMKAGDAANRQIAHLRTEDKNYLNKNHPKSKYKIDLLLAAEMNSLNERLKTKLRTTEVPFLEARRFLNAASLQNKQFSSLMKLGWNFFVANGYDLVPNWDTLQADVMQLTTSGQTYDLYMGTSGVLSLPDADGKNVDIYLYDEEKRFPVAKYLWMVVKGDNGAAAFLVLNSNGKQPGGNEVDGDEVCQSKCDQMPWLKKLTEDNAHTKVARGKVWCCDLDAFAEKVTELPALSGNFNLLI